MNAISHRYAIVCRHRHLQLQVEETVYREEKYHEYSAKDDSSCEHGARSGDN